MCCACFEAALTHAGAGMPIDIGLDMIPPVRRWRRRQGCRAVFAISAQDAPEMLGMSRILVTDLQANSMPLLFSTTVLRGETTEVIEISGPWRRMQLMNDARAAVVGGGGGRRRRRR